MEDQHAVLLDVTSRLARSEIPYMVSGSVALSFYAQPRMTRDIDVVVELLPAAVPELVRRLEPAYYVDADAVRSAARLRGMFNAIHLDLVVKVDFIVRKEGEYRELEFARRRRCELEGASLTFVAPEDLLLSKLVWARESGSELQLGDVRNLLASVEDLEMPYLREWAAKLGVGRRLEEALG